MAKRVVSFKEEEKLPVCYEGLAKEVRGFRTPKPMQEREAKQHLARLFPLRNTNTTTSC